VAEQLPISPKARSKWLRRGVLFFRISFYLLILLTFVGIEAYLHSPRFQFFVLRHRYEYRTAPSFQAAMKDAPPLDLIAYSDDPGEVTTLIASGKYGPRPKNFGPTIHAVPNNTAFDKWSQAEYGGSPAAPAVFMHARNLPGQEPLLVYVEIMGMKEDALHRLFIESGAMDRTHVRKIIPTDLNLIRGAGDAVRIYQGQIDPVDSARFTIRIEVNKKPYTLNGCLQSDNRITLIPDAGQLTWFGKDDWWIPPGIDVPESLEPGCFVTLPGEPRHYLGFFRRGMFRDVATNDSLLVK
jgi:hypothetical protein